MSVQAQSVLADEGTTITVMASQDWVYDAEMELGKQFEEETGIKVDYQIVPADQYYNMLMTKLNSGEGPDIFGGQSGSFDIVSQYNVEKNAVDLSDQAWVDTYDEFAKEQTSVDGKVYGMTYYDVSTDYYVVYNKRSLRKTVLKFRLHTQNLRKSARHFWTMISFRSMSPAQTDGIRQCGLQKSAENMKSWFPAL